MRVAWAFFFIFDFILFFSSYTEKFGSYQHRNIYFSLNVQKNSFRLGNSLLLLTIKLQDEVSIFLAVLSILGINLIANYITTKYFQYETLGDSLETESVGIYVSSLRFTLGHQMAQRNAFQYFNSFSLPFYFSYCMYAVKFGYCTCNMTSLFCL